MASGVPFVASAVGMNVEVAAGNTTGFVAHDDTDFAVKLVTLLGDAELRARVRQPDNELGLGQEVLGHAAARTMVQRGCAPLL